MKKNLQLMIDSGAYSSWIKQEEIDIEKYTDFCLKYLDLCSYFVNLDVIPGIWGDKNLSKEVVEESARKGFQNYNYMISKGIPKEKLIHVFHQGEDFKWLKRMINRMDYIGLSPANDRTTTEKYVWLEKCMEYVTDDKGMPIIKTHGFGFMSHKLLVSFPLYSADAITWVYSSRVGMIIVPRYVNGKYDYMKEPFKVHISSRSPEQKITTGFHYNTFPPERKKIVGEYCRSKGYEVGKSEFKTVIAKQYALKDYEKWYGKARKDGTREVEVIIEEGVSNNYKMRDELNIIYYLLLEKALPKWPWAYKKKRVIKGFR